eukprot:COSAG04_NODE_3245_length_3011_cov_1.367102_5_plen_218_part_01
MRRNKERERGAGAAQRTQRGTDEVLQRKLAVEQYGAVFSVKPEARFTREDMARELRSREAEIAARGAEQRYELHLHDAPAEAARAKPRALYPRRAAEDRRVYTFALISSFFFKKKWLVQWVGIELFVAGRVKPNASRVVLLVGSGGSRAAVAGWGVQGGRHQWQAGGTGWGPGPPPVAGWGGIPMPDFPETVDVLLPGSREPPQYKQAPDYEWERIGE